MTSVITRSLLKPLRVPPAALPPPSRLRSRRQSEHRLGSFSKPRSRKNCCSDSPKTKEVPQSRQVRVRSGIVTIRFLWPIAVRRLFPLAGRQPYHGSRFWAPMSPAPNVVPFGPPHHLGDRHRDLSPRMSRLYSAASSLSSSASQVRQRSRCADGGSALSSTSSTDRNPQSDWGCAAPFVA